MRETRVEDRFVCDGCGKEEVVVGADPEMWFPEGFIQVSVYRITNGVPKGEHYYACSEECLKKLLQVPQGPRVVADVVAGISKRS